MALNVNVSKVSLKIFVDTKAKKVVFAEAGKGFVDFIFHMLTLPLATVTKLLNDKDEIPKSLGALYRSVETLGSQYFVRNINKDSVLKPKTTLSVPLLSLHAPAMEMYMCTKCHSYMIEDSQTLCPICGNQMREMNYKYVSNSVPSGYVNELIYTVMDNLEVKPMSITHITSLVRDLDVLEKREVEVGLQEALAILKASLETNAVLTAAFLKT